VLPIRTTPGRDFGPGRARRYRRSMLRRRWPVIAFLAWTAYVWVTRIVNAWTASDESTLAKSISTVIAAGLVVAAGWGTAVLVRSRARRLTEGEVQFFTLFAGATVVVWALRIPQILLDGARDVPFKAVHVVLGVISVALAALTYRAVRGEGAVATGDIAVSPGAKAAR
jgi:hypothetical protein